MIVADSKARRDGPFIEIVGTYDPMKEPSEIKLDPRSRQALGRKRRAATDRARKLIEKAGKAAA